MLNKIRKIKFVTIFWVFFYILIFSLLLKGGFSYLDPDLGWHLRVGGEIAQSKELPKINNYNYTYTGSWVDHEWLSNYLMYELNTRLGYEALVVFFALIILLVLLILNNFIKTFFKDKIPFFVLASLELLAVIAALPHFGVRIQELSLLFLLLLMIIIHHYTTKKNWKYLIFLIPLFFLWANLHASFLLGLALLFAWLGIKFVESWFIKQKKYFYWLSAENILGLAQLGVFALFSLFSIVATFFTPYRLELYSFLSDYKNKAYLSLIQEWLPQHSFPFQYPQLIYMALGASALIFLGYLAFSRQKKVEAWYLFLSLLFLALSWSSRRHFPLFFIASFPLLASFYGDFFKDISLGSGIYKKYIQSVVLICIISVASVQFLELKPVTRPFEFFCNSYPCGALQFIKSNPEYLQGRLFNNYGWGGYLNYNLEDKKIFIDGRLPQVEFAGHTFIEEYYEFFKKETNKEDLLQTYDIDTILIPSQNKEIKVREWERFMFQIKKEDFTHTNYLRDYLDNSDIWRLVYNDKVANVYVRVEY